MTKFLILPQRRVNYQWRSCTDITAERFAVVELRTTIAGQPPRVKVISAFRTRAEATIAHDGLTHKNRKRKPADV